jgi:predicted phosphodiesterase
MSNLNKIHSHRRNVVRFSKNTIVLLAILLAGCASPDPNLKIDKPAGAAPWTHLNLYNDPNNFQFAIVADRTGGRRPGVFTEAVDKLNLLKPEFVLSIGDLIQGYTEDEAELDQQWAEFDALVTKLEMPFFYVPGNHDISNEAMADKWQQRLGPAYYHFVYRNVLLLCVNTEDTYKNWISQQQVDYFQNVLKANRNVRWTLVFMHKPAWLGEPVENWQDFESLLAHRNYTIFAGHKHRYNKSVHRGRRYYALSTTGGSNNDKEDKCRFDHITWVTMTDKGPQLANLRLEGILSDRPCPLVEPVP